MAAPDYSSRIATVDVSYVIDDHDRLIKLGGNFYAFAREAGWEGAGVSLGRVLWDFVAGEEMKRVQRILVRRVRVYGRKVELPFRCDGPEVRREMDVRIAPSSSGRLVLFDARMRSAEPREPQPLLDPAAPRGDGSLQMCGWCDRFRVAGQWVEVEEAARRLELFRRPKLPALAHAICPSCSRMLLAA